MLNHALITKEIGSIKLIQTFNDDYKVKVSSLPVDGGIKWTEYFVNTDVEEFKEASQGIMYKNQELFLQLRKVLKGTMIK